jgi:hypothetical protein
MRVGVKAMILRDRTISRIPALATLRRTTGEVSCVVTARGSAAKVRFWVTYLNECRDGGRGILLGDVIMSDELEERGFTSLVSRCSVAETAERVGAALQAKEITVFAVIDQSREAEKVCLALERLRELI